MSGARGPRRFRGTPVLRYSALSYRQRRRLNFGVRRIGARP